jgi:hypothetical protein
MGKIYPIGAAHLERLFRNRGFRENLPRLFGRRVYKERGFEVFQSALCEDFYMGDVLEGTQDSMFPYTILNRRRNKIDPIDFVKDTESDHNPKKLYVLVHLHTHPLGPHEVLMPSIPDPGDGMGDLRCLSFIREAFKEDYRIDLKPIAAICRSNDDGKSIEMLLVQEKTRLPVPYELLSEYRGEVFNDARDILDVVNVLEKTLFYNAEVLRFENARLEENARTKLEKFSFAPEYQR